MFRKRFWLRPIIALLIVSLLPVANLAGFALQPAGAQGMEPIVLLEDESDVDGDEVTLVFAMTDPSYVPEVDKLVFLGDGSTVTTDKYMFEYNSYYYVYEFAAWDLESGEHALYLNLIKNGVVEQTVPFYFTIPEKQPLTVYLFGPSDPINLEFYNETTEAPVVPGPVVSQGADYWAYTISAHPNEEFSLSADGYLLSNEGDFISGSEQWEYVVHAVEENYAVNLRESDISFDPDTGYISGYLRFRGVGAWGNYAVTVITDGGVIEACAAINDDIEEGDLFTCVLQQGETPLQVRIDYLTGNGYVPTNAAVNLQPVGLPENVEIRDTDSKLGSAAPYVEFRGPQASDIALFKIVPPVREEMEPDGVKYIPADGRPIYSAQLEGFDAYPGDRITIRMVDRNGHEYNDELVVPIVDSMTSGQTGRIDYDNYGCNNTMLLSYSHYYYCSDANPYESALDHDDAEYVDGSVAWTVPDTGNFIIVAYDLYFGYADGSAPTGIARVNIDPELETFSHPVTNIPIGADRVEVVPLLVHTEFEGFPYAPVYYAETFHIALPDQSIPQPPALDPPKVNGEDALQDELDPSGFAYLAFVDKEADSATITLSSPNGEIWINNEVPLGSGGEYTVELDGPSKFLTIYVRSPNDPDLFTIYFLSIYKDADPVIELTYHFVAGDSVYLYWFADEPSGLQYEVEIDLYKNVDNEPVPVESYGIEKYFYYAKLSSLDPATYKAVARMVHNGQDLASDEMTFEIPEPKPMHFYVFGPDTVLGNLQITGVTPYDSQIFETVDWTHDEGEGYVRYTILAKQGYCYTLSHDTYRFNTPNAYAYCTEVGPNHIVHATESAYDAHLDYVAIQTWMEGNLQGNLGFTKIGDYEDYKLVIVDTNGGEHACEVQENNGSSDVSFHCPDYSTANSKYLRINALVGQGSPVPTNAATRIDVFGRFSGIVLSDDDPDANSLDLTVRFNTNDETDVSLYRIDVPGVPGYGNNSFVETKEGDDPYIVHFGKLATHPGDRVIFYAYDRDGYRFSDYEAAGIIDVMTNQKNWISYNASCDTDSQNCMPVEPYGEFAGHEDAAVASEDDGTGNVKAFVRWMLPFTMEIFPVAYDIYYADSNKEIIRGEARVNLQYLTGEFRHPLSQAPGAAEYVAVVPILRANGNYFTLYHADPFYVPLSATATPDFIISVEGMVPLADGSYGYVPKGMTAGKLLSRFNVVDGASKQVLDKNGEPLDTDATVETGAKLVLSKDGVTRTITLRFVYEAMGKSGGDPVTITDIALFIIQQLNSTDPKDLTGDGKFDSEDTRLLLKELAE